MPYMCIYMSLDCLDNKRLGKQRVEAKQILDAITGKTKAWLNHPCTQMWIGYENYLKFYINTAIRLWKVRGFKNTMDEYVVDIFDLKIDEIPFWVGVDSFHTSHRLMLLKKNYKHYSRYFDANEKTIKEAQYYWPKKGDIF